MIIIAVDPGLTGGLALVTENGLQALVDMPVMVRSKSRVKGKNGQMRDKESNQVNASALTEILREWTADHDRNEIHVFIEKCQAMPGSIKGNPKAQSSAGTFSLGLSAGIIEGVVAARGLPHTLVHPATWKAALKLNGKDKNQVRARAIQLYPTASLHRVKDHNRAEALLIAHYGHQTYA